MSFICSSTPSTSGSLVSKVAHRQVLSFLYPVELCQYTGPRSRKGVVSNGRHHGTAIGTVEAWFISALARVGNCQQYTKKPLQCSPLLAANTPKPRSSIRQNYRVVCRRFQHSKPFDVFHPPLPKSGPDPEILRNLNGRTPRKPSADAVQPEPNGTREELFDLVDQYDGESFTDKLPVLELPRLYQSSGGPQLDGSDQPVDEPPPPHHVWPADMETRRKLQNLDLALLDQYKDPQQIFQLYRELPGPRVPYLTSQTRHKLLHHLSAVERKNEQSMLTYLSVVDDLKKMDIPLSASEWTSAISFVSRYVAVSTDIEVEAALHMWREMEHVAGVKGNGATFNVLFDVACKAGKFTLAEMIYQEMEKRGHQFNRYHHVSLIYYYGLKRNGDGARAAYKELVAAGEIVDTTVLNAMISALMKSREADAAENIYQRMKNLKHMGLKRSPKHFKSQRAFTSTLMKLAIRAKKYPAKLSEYQKRASLTPDSHTYQILVNHFAIQAGDLSKTAELLHEMKAFKLPVQGALFLALFKSFAVHGGVVYTQWTEVRLNSVLKALLGAIDKEVEGLYISKWMAIWILRAFYKCSGKSRTLEVWEELQLKWKPVESDLDFVMVGLRPLLESVDGANDRHDWLLGTGYA